MLVGAAGCGLFGPDEPGDAVGVLELEEGDCLLAPAEPQAEITTVRTVDCAQPHEQEVYLVEPFVDADGGTPKEYPGDATLTAFAEGLCLEEFEGYVGVDYRDSSLYFTYLLPSARGWQQGDRSVVCVVTTTGEQLEASVLRAGI